MAGLPFRNGNLAGELTVAPSLVDIRISRMALLPLREVRERGQFAVRIRLALENSKYTTIILSVSTPFSLALMLGDI